MATKIQIRRDTLANWAAANPVLASGEMGLETDTNKVKIGDGVTLWNSLAYMAGSIWDILSVTQPVTGGMMPKWDGTAWVMEPAPTGKEVNDIVWVERGKQGPWFGNVPEGSVPSESPGPLYLRTGFIETDVASWTGDAVNAINTGPLGTALSRARYYYTKRSGNAFGTGGQSLAVPTYRGIMIFARNSDGAFLVDLDLSNTEANVTLPVVHNWTVAISNGEECIVVLCDDSEEYIYTKDGGTNWSIGTFPSPQAFRVGVACPMMVNNVLGEVSRGRVMPMIALEGMTGEVWMSLDNGATWTSNTTATMTNWNNLVYDPEMSYLYATASGSLDFYKTPLDALLGGSDWDIQIEALPWAVADNGFAFGYCGQGGSLDGSFDNPSWNGVLIPAAAQSATMYAIVSNQGSIITSVNKDATILGASDRFGAVGYYDGWLYLFSYGQVQNQTWRTCSPWWKLSQGCDQTNFSALQGLKGVVINQHDGLIAFISDDYTVGWSVVYMFGLLPGDYAGMTTPRSVEVSTDVFYDAYVRVK